MELPHIDLQKLKRLEREDKEQKIDEFEYKKNKLIEKYIEIQDILEKYNEESYQLTCKIEQINYVISFLKE